ncbi:50S ribosomal protein L21 [Candidatus Uhrbacteria bacterium]|nr:50S ribosomal protein L21 [Candidatus Uhrbacteria bacterium]
MFAVIKTGGKQYLVKEGQAIAVEKVPGNAGDAVSFAEVLLVGEPDGSGVKVGTPLVQGARVQTLLVEQGKGKKVDVVKFKSKVRYRRKYGHRQPFTKVKVEKIVSA